MRHTVVGVWLADKPVVIGVIAGAHDVRGGDEHQFPEGLWATCVDADDAENAEIAAKNEMAESL